VLAGSQVASGTHAGIHLGPSNIGCQYSRSVCSSALHASSCGNLVVPRTRRRIGDRAFSVAVPRAWNRLPTELKLLRSFCLNLKTSYYIKASLGSLQRDLKTFLCLSLFTGTRIRIDSVRRPRSSDRGRNTTASVTVTRTSPAKQTCRTQHSGHANNRRSLRSWSRRKNGTLIDEYGVITRYSLQPVDDAGVASRVTRD